MTEHWDYVKPGQLEVIKLWATGYLLTEIAEELGIHRNTVNNRLAAFRDEWPEYFDNAESVRHVHLRDRQDIQRPERISDMDNFSEEDIRDRW